MSENRCVTNVAIVNTRSTLTKAKQNKAVCLDGQSQVNQHQITPSNLIIQSTKKFEKRKPLPLEIQFTANYSCGGSLTSLSVQNSSYRIMRIRRFPKSQFEISDISENQEKSRVCTLVSNFLGTKYSLFEHGSNILTILFTAGLCGNYGSRQFSIYSLAQNTMYSTLKVQYANQDLSELYALPQNQNKIQKFSTVQPHRNIENGQLSLNFARRKVIPAVQNAIIKDILGQQAIEFVKLGRNVYQVSFQHNIPKIWGVVLGLASLDFKWALQ